MEKKKAGLIIASCVMFGWLTLIWGTQYVGKDLTLTTIVTIATALLCLLPSCVIIVLMFAPKVGEMSETEEEKNKQ